ncbi:myotonic dystrophy kinase like protein [Nucleospora cyclopteri]
MDLNALIDITETMAKDLNCPCYQHIYQNKTKIGGYKTLKTLAKGGYGEVFLAENKGKIFAIKRVNKDMIKKNPNSTFFMNEREIMTRAKTEWLVGAHECLQDDIYLYFVMDFVPGGDLMGYLSKMDSISETEIVFYASEIAHALNEVHKLDFIHRDLKPDNIFIRRDGHISLGDFGSSAKMKDGRTSSSVPVGTPDYVCRDLLLGEKNEYGKEVDFWTLGVIIYEMIVGEPPFFTDSLKQTYQKILRIEYEKIQSGSAELRDLLDRLICEKEKRLDFEGVKKHPFFKGIDWSSMGQQKPPFVPEVKDEGDISNFVDVNFKADDSSIWGGYKEFVGFTFDPKYVSTFGEVLSAQISQGIDQKEKQELDQIIESKMMEIDDLNWTIEDLNTEKQIKAKELSENSMQLSKLVSDLMQKKEELNCIKDGISCRQEELHNIKSDISSKMEVLKNPNQNAVVLGAVKDMRNSLERARLGEEISEIKSIAYWFYRENETLRKQIEIQDVKVENSDVDELKKQLRIYKTEIRDYQARIEQEIAQKYKLETDLKQLREAFSKVNTAAVQLSFSVTNAITNIPLSIKIDRSIFIYNGKDYSINSIYVRDSKPGEYHHFPYKKKALTVIIHFLKESTSSTKSSAMRRSLKCLEEDLEKELVIYKGIEDLKLMLTGTSQKEVEEQRQGTIKKIEHLQQEISRAKNSTITEYELGDEEKVYEFNNHIFREHTVGKGTLCDHCNDVLYGVVNQSYHCRDCLLTVHKSCYVLVATSCELQKAINRGKMVPIVCKSIEEKERLMKVFQPI